MEPITLGTWSGHPLEVCGRSLDTFSRELVPSPSAFGIRSTFGLGGDDSIAGKVQEVVEVTEVEVNEAEQEWMNEGE